MQYVILRLLDEQRGAAEKQMLDEMKLLRQEGYPLDARQLDGSTYVSTFLQIGYIQDFQSFSLFFFFSNF